MLRSGKTTLLNKQDLNIDHQKKEFISQIGLELSPSNSWSSSIVWWTQLMQVDLILTSLQLLNRKRTALSSALSRLEFPCSSTFQAWAQLSSTLREKVLEFSFTIRYWDLWCLSFSQFSYFWFQDCILVSLTRISADLTAKWKTIIGSFKERHYQPFSASCLGCGISQHSSSTASLPIHFLPGLSEEPGKSHLTPRMMAISYSCKLPFWSSGATQPSTWTHRWTMVSDISYHQSPLLLSFSSSSSLFSWLSTQRVETNTPCGSKFWDLLDQLLLTYGKIKHQISHSITYLWWSIMTPCSFLKVSLTSSTSSQWWEPETSWPNQYWHQPVFSYLFFSTLWALHKITHRRDSCSSTLSTATTPSNASTQQAPGCGSLP